MDVAFSGYLMTGRPRNALVFTAPEVQPGLAGQLRE